MGQLWAAGVHLDWEAFYEDERRYRIPLPTYPFQRQRHWVEPDMNGLELSLEATDQALTKRKDVDSWLYVPSWRRAPINGSLPRAGEEDGPWLILRDELGGPWPGS
jgi:acyl transferase domain-containing protein